MITLGLVTVGALVGFAVLIRKWRNGVPSIVLPALPLALLFLVAPIPPAIFHMIRGFQQISERGDAGIVVVAGYALEIDRSLFWGSIAFVVVMIAAGTLQWNAKHDETEITDTALEPVAPNQPPSVVEKILLVGSSLLALPAFALMRLTGGIPRLVMSAAMQLDPAARSMTPVAPSDLANTRYSDLVAAGQRDALRHSVEPSARTRGGWQPGRRPIAQATATSVGVFLACTCRLPDARRLERYSVECRHAIVRAGTE